MVTLNQVQNGLVAYIDNEILPHLTGIKQFGLGFYSALASRNAANAILKYKDNPAIKMLEVLDENNNVDLDALYQAACDMFTKRDKYSIDIPLIGEWAFDRSDIEKLYKYIKG